MMTETMIGSAVAGASEAPKLPTDAIELLSAVLEHRGWEKREGQLKMVEAIAKAFETDDFSPIDVAINAPVGTGKTLGYIIASIARGGRVVVATSTKSLQEQIIAEELPKLKQDLQAIYGFHLTYGVLKGQGNYACLDKIREALAKLDGTKKDDDIFDVDVPDNRDVAVMREILRRAEEALEDGDVLRYDSEHLLARLTPDGQKKFSATKGCSHKSKKWWTVSEDSGEATVNYSLGSQYREYMPRELVDALAHDNTCAYRAAYANCVMSDVVVLNSSLLVSEIQRDATSEHADILAGSTVVVVDEAHHLSRILAESYSSTTDFEKMFNAFKDVIPKIGKRYGEDARAMMEAVRNDLIDLENELIDIDDSDMGVKAHRLAIGKAANAWREKAVPVLAALKVKAATEKSSEAVNMEGVPKPLAELLRPIDGDEDSAVAQVGILKGVMQVNDKDEFVNELTILGRETPSAPALVVKQVPVDVTRFRYDISRRSTAESLLHESAGPAAIVLSSGTITKLTPMMVGMKPKSFIDVESPFDSRKARLYIPASIPEPNGPTWVPDSWREMKRAIEMVDGRAMILTTSKQKTLEFAELAKRDLRGRNIITQYDGAKRDVVARFAADEHSVIVGTISLWEGVDVPGSSLSLVIMDKMPFPMPNDAVFAARRKWIEKHKGNPFMEVDVDHASVMLAQGAGRLIRATGDIGAVMIMDKRIISKRYGPAAIGLLPHDWMMTSDKKAFEDWLEWVNPATRKGQMPKIDPRVWRPIKEPRKTNRKRIASD
jgi:ATP-dependent DNA helicase DinG